MAKLFNERQDLNRLSSADVIASGVDFGIFSAKYRPVLDGNSTPKSAIGRKIDLGDRAGMLRIKDTKRTKTALEGQLEPRSPQSVPTADFISTTSYKKNAKLIIRVIPTASLGDPKDVGNVQITGKVEPELSFDKFSLQAVSENDDERYQLHETFDDATLFLFQIIMDGMLIHGKHRLFPFFQTQVSHELPIFLGSGGDKNRIRFTKRNSISNFHPNIRILYFIHFG